MHYCGPAGNIPHDQTNQSPWWDAGVTQPCSNTPFHSLSGTNTWSPINGAPRTHEEGCFSTVSMVHGWWLHNHTFILTKEKGDELPNNVSHRGNTNPVIDAAFVGTATCCITHSPTYSDNLRRGGGGWPGWQPHGQQAEEIFASEILESIQCASSKCRKMPNKGWKAKQQKDEVRTRKDTHMGMLVLLQTLWAYFLTQKSPANDIQSIVKQHESALQEVDRGSLKERELIYI